MSAEAERGQGSSGHNISLFVNFLSRCEATSPASPAQPSQPSPAQPGRESDSTPGTFQTAGVVHSVGTCAGPDTIQLVGGAGRYIFFLRIEIFLCTLLLLFCRHITCSFVQLGRGQTCDKSHSVSSKHFWSWWFCRTCHMKTVIRPCGSQCGSDCWFCWQMF